MHGPDLSMPAAMHIVLETEPEQTPSHLKPAPHTAAPAAVASVQGREQKRPMAVPPQAEYPMQRAFGQSPSVAHCFSHARSVWLYPMHVSPEPHSLLVMHALPCATVPAWVHAYCRGGPHVAR
jgi:hypothetical protein